MIYMDNAATSYPKPPEVREKIAEALENSGNPGRGSHELAVWSAAQIQETRENLATLLHLDDPFRIAFTLNATHSLNIAVNLCYGEILTTAMDHNSVLRPCARRGYYRIVAADSDGNLDPERVIASISDMTGAVIMTHASNVTGQIYEIEPIARACRKRGVLFILDAAQTAGNTELDLRKTPIDVLCMTGHKSLFGVQGTGAIYVSPEVRTRPYMCGGTGTSSFDLNHPTEMPECFEAGTVNTHGVCALGAGVRYVLRHGVSKIHREESLLRAYFAEELQKLERVRVYGLPPAKRRGKTFSARDYTGTISCNIRGSDPSAVAEYLARNGVCVRSGFHCAPLAHRMLGTAQSGTVRFSLNHFNTKQEIDEVIRLLRDFPEEDGARSAPPSP